MKVLVITGPNASGKSFLIWHMRQRCKLLMLEPTLTSMNAWVPPQSSVDAVVLDHFARVPNITEIARDAAKWCASNNCPLIVVGQSGAALDQVMPLLPNERVVLHLERNYDTNRVRVASGQQVEDLSVESLMDKAFGLVGIEMAGLRLGKNC